MVEEPIVTPMTEFSFLSAVCCLVTVGKLKLLFGRLLVTKTFFQELSYVKVLYRGGQASRILCWLVR